MSISIEIHIAELIICKSFGFFLGLNVKKIHKSFENAEIRKNSSGKTNYFTLFFTRNSTFEVTRRV